ncbi:MAG: erfK, partial [Labilithrix sp.]|nr:erfK [Labilithrix sp.]
MLSSCQNGMLSKSDNYDSPAYRPHNPSAVRVKVSLSQQMVYVMEGNRPLLVTATCVGMPQKPTPRGNFTVYNKIAKKRSGSYGFGVSGGTITPAEASKARGRYVGYPMPYWVEFSPGYGFHSGYVHPFGKSHGCLRLHPNVAPKFFALVREGTPVNIANSQPEDAILGA